MPEGQAGHIALVVPTELVEAAGVIWWEQKLDDAQLHDPVRQRAFSRQCAVALGSRWSELASDIGAALAEPPHWAVLSTPENRPAPVLLAAVAASLGVLCDPYNATWSRILQEIATKTTPTPDLQWHTDSTGWPRPNTITALSCVRAAPKGGATELLTLGTVRAACAYDGVLGVLEQARFAWPQDPELGGGHVIDNIVTQHRVRFMRAPLLERTSGSLRVAVRQFVDIVDAFPPDLSVVLAPGDILLFDNTRSLHRRGEIDDPRRERLLLRAKIMGRLRRDARRSRHTELGADDRSSPLTQAQGASVASRGRSVPPWPDRAR